MRNSPSEQPVSCVDPPPVDRVAEQRITRLFESMRPDLLRFALWLTRDRAVAEDVVQEALLRAWRSRDALKDLACSRAWLLTIVRREHARLYERKRLELVSLNDATEHEADALTSKDESDIHALHGAILRLPIEYREPLVMQVLGGFSIEEIAQELSLSASAVLTRLFRARNKLRTVYGLASAPDALAREEAP
ncbi:MAG TPA: sigma-70 family RNA polymerase sigma factor [Steroidobacteraceae bacterium]